MCSQICIYSKPISHACPHSAYFLQGADDATIHCEVWPEQNYTCSAAESEKALSETMPRHFKLNGNHTQHHTVPHICKLWFKWGCTQCFSILYHAVASTRPICTGGNTMIYLFHFHKSNVLHWLPQDMLCSTVGLTKMEIVRSCKKWTVAVSFPLFSPTRARSKMEYLWTESVDLTSSAPENKHLHEGPI